MTESEFLIKIKTLLEDQGIKLTDEQFENLNKSAKKFNEDTHEGHKTLLLDHRELKESIGAIGRAFGGLADVGLWLNPITAGLAAVLAAVEAVKKQLDNAKEAAAQLADETEAINSARMRAFADAANDAASAMQSLAIEEDKLNTAYTNGNTAIENRLKLFGQEQDAQTTLDAARQQAFEAEMHREVALGRVSEERAAALISESKLKGESQRAAAESARMQAEIDQLQGRLDEGPLQYGMDTRAVSATSAAEIPAIAQAAASKKAAEDAASGKFSSTYTDWRGGTGTFSGSVEDLKKQIREQREGQEGAEARGMPEIADKYKHDADALQDILNRQEKYIENLGRIAQGDKEKAAAAHAQAEAAKAQYDSDQEFARTAPARLEALQKELELHKGIAAAVQAQHAQAASVEAQTSLLNKAHHLEDQLTHQSQHGGGDQIAARLGSALDRMLTHMEYGATSKDWHDLSQIVAGLESRLNDMERRQAVTRSVYTP
jgi:hypothetical protein